MTKIEQFCEEQNALRQAELNAMREANAHLRRVANTLTGPPLNHNHTREVSAQQVQQAVSDCYGDKQAAANLLGIPLPAVYRRLATLETSSKG